MSLIFIGTSTKLSDHEHLIPLARSLASHYNNTLMYVSFCELPQTLSENIHVTYVPSKETSNLTPKDWNTLFFQTLFPIFSMPPIDVVVLEGNFVYAGLIQLMKIQYQAHYIWIKRPTSQNLADPRKKYFDTIHLLSEDLAELPQITGFYA